ncbi:MAG: DNA/RNA nuclease SfsA [Planctomycetaceae bacterium]|nr:DNA/RNA nuclease SfsA [Planctomycetaceae bacterium]
MPDGMSTDTTHGYLSAAPGGGLYWGTLTRATLLRRYKRFLADVRLDDGSLITAHTANTGAMTGCSEPGRPVYLSWHGGGARKYDYTLEMVDMPSALVGVNTGVPNRLLYVAAEAGVVPEFLENAKVRREVRCGDSRLDLMLQHEGGPDVMVEIKNCSLVEDGTAFFPDAVTQRGRKHLEELARLAQSGARAVLFILIQRGDALRFAPADHIDPEWGQTLRRVVGQGVEVLAYRADVTLTGIWLGERLPIIL